MKYLVDANVLSEATRPIRSPWSSSGCSRTSARLWSIRSSWARSGSASCFYRGGSGAPLWNTGSRRMRRVHCLPWDAQTGLRWASLLASLRGRGHAMPIKDSLIAATALVHGLVVVTGNESDFERAGVEVMNPFRSG